MTSRLKILRAKLPRLKSPRSKQWPERHDCIRNLRSLKWFSHFPSQNYRNSWCSSRSKQTQGKNAPAPCHAPSVRRGPLSPHRPHARCPRRRCRRWWVRWSSSFAASMRPRDPKDMAGYGRMVKQWTKEMILPSLDILRPQLHPGMGFNMFQPYLGLDHAGAHKGRWLPGEEIKMGKRSCLNTGINSNRDWNDGLEVCFYILHPKLKSDL